MTDFPLSEDNLMRIMRSGRARWRIENETFNTLKNQDYQHLTTVLMHLMMLAFLMDQIQQRCCGLFQQVIKKMGSKLHFWLKVRQRFSSYLVSDWEILFESLAY